MISCTGVATAFSDEEVAWVTEATSVRTGRLTACAGVAASFTDDVVALVTAGPVVATAFSDVEVAWVTELTSVRTGRLTACLGMARAFGDGAGDVEDLSWPRLSVTGLALVEAAGG